MKKTMIHTALFRLVTPIPFGALIYLLLLIINNNLLSISESFLSAELFFCIILSYISFEANRLSIVLFFTKSNWTPFSILIQIGTNSLITLILIYLSLYTYFIYFLGFSSMAGFSTEIKSFSIFFGFTSILYTALSLSYKLLNKKNEQLLDDEETLKAQIQYELDAYQAEVNPELLFESLESAISLIDKDVDMAEDYIDQLALVYRYMLSNRDNDSIALRHEINAADNLISLHNVRNQNLIHFEVNLADNELQVIPGSLPLLVEEIIKNSLIYATRPLNIVLAREDNYLTLSHKANERLIKNNREAMMFKRLQNAYSFFTDQPLIKIRAYGDNFYKIPILREVA